MLKRYSRVVFLIASWVMLTTFFKANHLEVGDLLFQDLNCGALCDAITGVTYGFGAREVSHVAVVVKIKPSVMVEEAIGSNVHITPLSDFLRRSLDNKGNPRVMVGRLQLKYKNLIPKAVFLARQFLGKPYNEGFVFDNKLQKFYCSQLVYDMFRLANHGRSFFRVDRMTFKKDGKTLRVWKHYFYSIHKKIPEGMYGTNPGMMSRSHNVRIIYFYGKLRTIKKQLRK